MDKKTMVCSDVLNKCIFDITEIFSLNKKNEDLLKTGFINLDRVTSGLKKSELVVIAGRPSTGKTSFALNITNYLLIEENKTVAFFTYESSNQKIIQKILSANARIEFHKLLKAERLRIEELKRLAPQANLLVDTNLYVNDNSHLNIDNLINECKEIHENNNLDIVVVDNIQLMAGINADEGKSVEDELMIITSKLKALAKELNCVVLAISQVNRDPEKRINKRPLLHDLRDCGAIEENADIVLVLYRDEFYDDNSVDKGICEVIVRKNRHGPLDTIKLAFCADFTSFHNLAQFYV